MIKFISMFREEESPTENTPGITLIHSICVFVGLTILNIKLTEYKNNYYFTKNTFLYGIRLFSKKMKQKKCVCIRVQLYKVHTNIFL